jgi:hypothetical protein
MIGYFLIKLKIIISVPCQSTYQFSNHNTSNIEYGDCADTENNQKYQYTF